MPKRKRSLLLIWSACLFCCSAPAQPLAASRRAVTATPGPRPAWFPARSCQDAWGELPPGTGDYDFKGESRLTPAGNLGYEKYPARTGRARCYKPWTLLLYVAADNDLKPYAYLDLYEMEAARGAGEGPAASTVTTDVLVRLDTPESSGLRRMHMFETTEPYQSSLTRCDFLCQKETALRSPIVALDRERAPFDPAADLKDFLTWGMTHYPAEHYMVVVWGHGEGWGLRQKQVPPAPQVPVEQVLACPSLDACRAAPPDVPPGANPFAQGTLTGGIAFDWAQRTYLGVPALHETLQAVVRETLGGQPIDIYASDACLMQSVEVTTELADVARFIAGSTQVEDFLGTSYRKLLQRLNTGTHKNPACQGQPDEEACAVARLIPEVYRDSLADGLRQALSAHAPERFTLSSVRTSTLRAELLPALSRFGRAMTDYLGEDRTHPGRVHFIFEDPDAQLYFGNDQDLGTFLDGTEEMLNKEKATRKRNGQLTPAGAGLQQAIAAVRVALDRTEVQRAYGSDYAGKKHFNAYSVWLPRRTQDYQLRKAEFAVSAFYQYDRQHDRRDAPVGPWQGWLDQLFAASPDSN